MRLFARASPSISCNASATVESCAASTLFVVGGVSLAALRTATIDNYIDLVLRAIQTWRAVLTVPVAVLRLYMRCWQLHSRPASLVAFFYCLALYPTILAAK